MDTPTVVPAPTFAPSKGITINPEFNTSAPNWLMKPNWWKPVAGGRKPSADAPVLYLWCLDKVTKTEEHDGIIHGLVLGYRGISFKAIAACLEISWSSVQRNMQHLVDVGLVCRTRTSSMQEYSYSVPNCRKQFEERAKKLEGRNITRKATTKPVAESESEEEWI